MSDEPGFGAVAPILAWNDVLTATKSHSRNRVGKHANGWNNWQSEIRDERWETLFPSTNSRVCLSRFP